MKKKQLSQQLCGSVCTVWRVASALILFQMTVSGCNPANFFGRTQGQRERVTSYRRLNLSCTGLTLSSSVLSVATFRQMVDCFAAGGDLGAIQTLVQGLSDAELRPIVETLNEKVLGSPETLYKIEKTVDSLTRAGLLDEGLRSFGKLMRRDLVSSSIALLKDGYFAPVSAGERARGGLAPDRELLKALEILSRKVTPAVMENALSVGLNSVGSRAFSELQTRVVQEVPTRHTIEHVSRGVHNYLLASHTYRCDESNPAKEITQDFLSVIRHRDYVGILDSALGVTTAEIQTKVPRINYLLDQTIASRGADTPCLMASMADAMGALNIPIECPGANVPNGARHLVRKLAAMPSSQAASYILDDSIRELYLLRPVCELPPVQSHYASMLVLAESGAVEPMADLLKALDRPQRAWMGCQENEPVSSPYHPLTSLAVNFLGDAHFRESVPMMEMIADYNVWQELLLLAALPGNYDRETIEEAFKFMAEARPELRGKSLFEVFNQVTSRAGYVHLYQFMVAVRDLITDPEFTDDPQFLSRMLGTVRSSLLVNNINPFIALTGELMAESEQRADLFTTLFRISDSPNFLAAVELLQSLAASGDLKDLVRGTVDLFHRFAVTASSRVSVEERTVPPFVPVRRHDLTRADLAPSGLGRVAATDAARLQHCRDLDLDFSFIEVDSPQFASQFDHLIACLGDPAISQTALFMKDEKTQSGESYFKLLTRMAKQMKTNDKAPASVMSEADFAYLARRFRDQDERGPIYRVLDSIPLLLGTPVPQNYMDSRIVGSAIKILDQVFAKNQSEMHRTLEFAAKVLKEEDSPKFLADLHDIADRADVLETRPPSTFEAKAHLSADLPLEALRLPGQDNDNLYNEIKQKVRIVECWAKDDLHLTDAEFENRYVPERVREIFEETQNSNTTWKRYKDPETGMYRAQTSWKLDDLKAILNPLLEKAADPSQNRKNTWVMDSTLNFLKGYNGTQVPSDYPLPVIKSHPKTPIDLRNWFLKRSRDYRAVILYYDGVPGPMVVAENTLDRLDSVLLATDVKDPFSGKTFAIDFLNEIADAWGDEKPSDWPQEVIEEYRRTKKMPETLAEAVHNIYFRNNPTENLKALKGLLIGVPSRPSCMAVKAKEIGVDVDSIYPNSHAAGNWGSWFVRLILSMGARKNFTEAELVAFQRNVFNITQVRDVLADNLTKPKKVELLSNFLKPGAIDLLVTSNIQPGVQSQVVAPYEGGLEVLRNIFFLVKRTSPTGGEPVDPKNPDGPKKPDHRSLTNGDLNNLSAILRSVRVGSLRQLGRIIQNWDENDPAFQELDDVVASVVRMSSAPNGVPLMRVLLESDKGVSPEGANRRKLIWNILSQVFDVIDEGPETVQRLKTTAFYGMAALQKVQPRSFARGEGPLSNDLVNLMSTQMEDVLREHTEFLGKDEDFLKDVLKAKRGAVMSQAAYEFYTDLFKSVREDSSELKAARARAVHFGAMALARPEVNCSGPSPGPGGVIVDAARIGKNIYENPETHLAWNIMSDELNALKKTPEWLALDLEGNTKDMLYFLEHRGEYTDADSVRVSDKMRKYTAFQLESGNLEQILRLPNASPAQAYHMMTTFGKSVRDGEYSRIKDFLKLLREGLLEPAH